MASRVIFDDFERDSLTGTGNPGWYADGAHPTLAVIVTSPQDAGPGPYSGTRMLRTVDSGGDDWSTAAIDTDDYDNEVFIRIRVRVDSNHQRTSGSPYSPKKYMRIFENNDPYRDAYCVLQNGGTEWFCGSYAEGNMHYNYTGWGGGQAATSGAWHMVEYYWNHTTRTGKHWQDGVLLGDGTVPNGMSNTKKYSPFFVASNWSDPHSGNNYCYFDYIEVFSDRNTGTPATGSMSDRSIAVGGLLDAPTGIRWRPA